MRPILLSSLCLCAFAAVAHADPVPVAIDDFVLTGPYSRGTQLAPLSHTYTFSLPAHFVVTTPPHLHEIGFSEFAIGTVDGVGGQPFYLTFTIPVYPITFSLNSLDFVGPSLINDPRDTFFRLGTFGFSGPTIAGFTYFDTLTITAETVPSAVPEPSSLLLIATGAASLLFSVPRGASSLREAK